MAVFDQKAYLAATPTEREKILADLKSNPAVNNIQSGSGTTQAFDGGYRYTPAGQTPSDRPFVVPHAEAAMLGVDSSGWGGQQQQVLRQPPAQYQQQAPQFNLDARRQLLNEMFGNRLSSEQTALRNARDTALQGYNKMETSATQQAYNARNQSDAIAEQNAAKIRELMAARGLTSGGENLTAQTNLLSARQQALGDINLQRNNILADIGERRSLLENQAASQEQALIKEIEADRIRSLLDLERYGDDIAFRQDDKDYSRYRDSINDLRYDKEFDIKYNSPATQFTDTIYKKLLGGEQLSDTERQAIGLPVTSPQQQYTNSIYNKLLGGQELSTAEKQAIGMPVNTPQQDFLDGIYTKVMQGQQLSDIEAKVLGVYDQQSAQQKVTEAIYNKVLNGQKLSTIEQQLLGTYQPPKVTPQASPKEQAINSIWAKYQRGETLTADERALIGLKDTQGQLTAKESTDNYYDAIEKLEARMNLEGDKKITFQEAMTYARAVEAYLSDSDYKKLLTWIETKIPR